MLINRTRDLLTQLAAKRDATNVAIRSCTLHGIVKGAVFNREFSWNSQRRIFGFTPIELHSKFGAARTASLAGVKFHRRTESL